MGLGLERNHAGAFAVNGLIRQSFPIVALAQIVFVDRVDGSFGVVFFAGGFGRFGFRRRSRGSGSSGGRAFRFEEGEFAFHAFADVLERTRVAGTDDRLPNTARGDVARTVELMGRQRLVILVVAQCGTLVVERSKSSIENFERCQFLFVGRKRQPTRQQKKEKADAGREWIPAAHARRKLFYEAAPGDQINREAAEPMSTFVVSS